MRNLMNFLIRKIKKEQYTIDEKVPGSYLLNLVLTRAYMLIKGKLSFVKHSGSIFVGKNVTIKAKNLITVGSGVTFNNDTYVDAVSQEGIRFGNNVSVGKRTVVECTGNMQFLGKGFWVGNNVGLGTDSFYGCNGGIVIGDDTIIGNYVSFHAENHNFKDPDIPIRCQGVNHKGIKIGNNCWIGAKATILDGVTVEDGCIIAAGAVMIAGVYKANGIYGGNPAKLLKYRFAEKPKTVISDTTEVLASSAKI